MPNRDTRTQQRVRVALDGRGDSGRTARHHRAVERLDTRQHGRRHDERGVAGERDLQASVQLQQREGRGARQKRRDRVHGRRRSVRFLDRRARPSGAGGRATAPTGMPGPHPR